MIFREQDTITAISTAMTPSGLGIVRVSGHKAILVGEKVFKSGNSGKLSEASGNTIHYGHIMDGEEAIDEVLVTVLRAPHSFTAEDTIEINCHGGPHILKRVLELTVNNGARPAEPGEFSKRAFLNGRIDLAQAEAIGELIGAKNETARKASLDKLRGKASSSVKNLRNEILHETAFIEAAMDDPEHIDIEGCSERLDVLVDEWSEKIRNILDETDRGRILRDGIKTVIVGKPNVGKSSLMNLLLGEDRAIVTDIAGTTRDTLEEEMVWDGISLNIIDTAGIRETEDVVESIGVDRAKKALDDADLVLLLADASKDITEEDMDLYRQCEGKTVIALLNKTDLAQDKDPGSWGKFEGMEPIRFSAKKGIGINELKNRVQELFYTGAFANAGSGSGDAWLANARQKDSLEKALNSLKLVKESIMMGAPEDMYTIDLNDAYRELGYIIGEEVEDDLIEKIFADFCMGK